MASTNNILNKGPSLSDFTQDNSDSEEIVSNNNANNNYIKNPTNQISNENLKKIEKILKVNGKELNDQYKKEIEECEPEVFKELVEYLENFRFERIKGYNDCFETKKKFSEEISLVYSYIINATESLSFILDLPELIEEKSEKKEGDEKHIDQGEFFLQFQFNNDVYIEKIEQMSSKLQNDINQYCINKNLDPNNENIMSFLSKDVNAIEIASAAYFKIALLNPDKIEQIKQCHLFFKFAFESLIEKLEAYQNSDKNKQNDKNPPTELNLNQKPEAPLADKKEENLRSRSNSGSSLS